MDTTLQQEVEEAREAFVGRLFLLGGSALFLIGGIISAIASYKTFIRLLNTPPSQ
ncbi:hypothetical protein ACFDTO_29955 [Microbacteriaceae bacterium 4G12]